jgi:hypothetical protein
LLKILMLLLYCQQGLYRRLFLHLIREVREVREGRRDRQFLLLLAGLYLLMVREVR